MSDEAKCWVQPCYRREPVWAVSIGRERKDDEAVEHEEPLRSCELHLVGLLRKHTGHSSHEAGEQGIAIVERQS